MAPEKGAHLRVKTAVWQALHIALRANAIPCQAIPDGVTVQADENDYEQDVVVNCGEPMADDAVAAPHPVVVVEVFYPREPPPSPPSTPAASLPVTSVCRRSFIT